MINNFYISNDIFKPKMNKIKITKIVLIKPNKESKLINYHLSQNIYI